MGHAEKQKVESRKQKWGLRDSGTRDHGKQKQKAGIGKPRMTRINKPRSQVFLSGASARWEVTADQADSQRSLARRICVIRVIRGYFCSLLRVFGVFGGAEKVA
jgi:hypothetical protein